MKSVTKKPPSGFTLIELMVAIGIIGILSTIVYASLGESRKIARDNIRQTDLKSLQVAIELFKAQNGRYPAAGCGNVAGGALPNWAGSETIYTSAAVASCPGTYIVGLVPDYIPVLPSEVGSNKNNTGYAYTSNLAGTEYKLLSHHNVEAKLISDIGDDFSRFAVTCTGPTYNPLPVTETNTYAVYSRNAGCW